MEVIDDFDRFHQETLDGSEVTWNLEFQEYLGKSLYELEQIYTYLSQASEIKLRSMVCEVSPFLLLANSENKFKSGAGDVDFTELRTVDAVDLPALVNVSGNRKLPDDFVRSYHGVRSQRNKIMHLGAGPKKFDHLEVISALVSQYQCLWEGKRWFKNWVEHSSSTRYAHFHDEKYSSEYTGVILYVPTLSMLLTKSQFRVLFGFSKSIRRYICWSCCEAACVERNGFDPRDLKTAVLAGGDQLNCAVCEEQYRIRRCQCRAEGCKGNVILDEDDMDPMCLTCGSYYEEP
ncbi:MAG TPA: hypothetical protein PK450_11640 [Paracoccaceae bacterium]|nr:hypothetical protein [Paracoccaceae bacterium]